MIKPLYKPAGMIANVLGGLLAGAIKNGWKIAAREDDAPGYRRQPGLARDPAGRRH